MEVFTVSVVDSASLRGATVAGEKLHEDPVANPEHANETAELNPLSGATVITAVVLCPAVTFNDDVEAAIEKSGGIKLIVYDALTIVLSE